MKKHTIMILISALIAPNISAQTTDYEFFTATGELTSSTTLYVPFTGTFRGTWNSISNPTGTKTKPGLSGPFTEDENLPVPFSGNAFYHFPSSTLPPSNPFYASGIISINESNLTAKFSNLITLPQELPPPPNTTSNPWLEIQYPDFRTKNPSDALQASTQFASDQYPELSYQISVASQLSQTTASMQRIEIPGSADPFYFIQTSLPTRRLIRAYAGNTFISAFEWIGQEDVTCLFFPDSPEHPARIQLSSQMLSTPGHTLSHSLNNTPVNFSFQLTGNRGTYPLLADTFTNMPYMQDMTTSWTLPELPLRTVFVPEPASGTFLALLGISLLIYRPRLDTHARIS